MKERLVVILIYSLGINVSYANELQMYPVSKGINSISAFSDLEFDFQITHERKVQRLMNCENYIYHLSPDVSYIRGTIVPEIKAKRLILAPNYPETNVFGAEKEALISNWILNYESEYDSLIGYYETLIRSHH